MYRQPVAKASTFDSLKGQLVRLEWGHSEPLIGVVVGPDECTCCVLLEDDYSEVESTMIGYGAYVPLVTTFNDARDNEGPAEQVQRSSVNEEPEVF